MCPHKSAFQLKTLLNFLPPLPSFNETQNYLRIIHLSLDNTSEDNDHAQLVSDNQDNDDDHPNTPT